MIMRTHSAGAALAAVLLLTGWAAAEPETVVEAPIRQVTVHPDRALVTRAGSLRLRAGRQEVVVEGLAPNLDADSLRARLEGDGFLRVLAVDVRDQVLDHAERPGLTAARERYESARTRRETAEQQVADTTRLRALLLGLRAGSTESDGGFDAGGFGSTGRFLDQRLPAARAELLEAETELRRAREAEAAAKLVLDQLRSSGDRSRRRAVVAIEAEQGGTATLSLDYLAAGASWRPVYELRVDDSLDRAELELSAEVAQRTGEDWSDVPLSFTTAQPSLGSSPPTLAVWALDRRPELAQLGGGLVRMRRMEKKLADSEDAKVADKLGEVLERGPRLRTGGALVAFEAPRAESIVSGAGARRVTLAGFDLDPEALWTAFPRETEHVFATARLRNTTGVLLPGGTARVHVGPDLVGELELADWAPDERRDVGLGVDRMVTAEREELVRTRDEEGFFSKEVVHRRSYRLTLENRRDREILVRLLDQVPVSTDDALAVEVTRTTHALAELPAREAEENASRGVLTWRFRMYAGGTYAVTFDYTLTHPTDRDAFGIEDDR